MVAQGVALGRALRTPSVLSGCSQTTPNFLDRVQLPRMNFSKKALASSILVISVLALLGGTYSLLSRAQTRSANPLAQWRPSGDIRGIRFVGSKACVECHAAEAAQLATPMAQALATASDCELLSARRRLTFRNGGYSYEISRQGKRVLYTVTDGAKTISEPILYCFGQGHVGQTYIFRHNEVFYETRVSYFERIKTLDFTIGHNRAVPTSLEDALGRGIGADEVQACFGCHSTGAVSGARLQLDQLTPGVGCEACHGPGEKHIAAAKARDFENLQIFDPRSLSTHDLTQSFCGACHTSFDQAMLMPGQSGINNIRFQPYRMFNSPGHNTDDARIGCLACHNVHLKLEKEATFYDSKCLACHLTHPQDAKTAKRTASACPVSTVKCVTCHMPKVELPGMHAAFTDHWIRIAKPGDPVPH